MCNDYYTIMKTLKNKLVAEELTTKAEVVQWLSAEVARANGQLGAM